MGHIVEISFTLTLYDQRYRPMTYATTVVWSNQNAPNLGC
jgi:hypothetical protein